MTRSSIVVLSALCAIVAAPFVSDNARVHAQQKLYTPDVGILRVFEFRQEKYDDGRSRTLYGAYEVYDGEGRRVLNVRASWDRPRTVRLRKGTYVVKGTRESGEKTEFNVLVEGGKFTEINVDQTSLTKDETGREES